MLGSKVKIAHTEVTGVVVAELHHINGNIQFEIRYTDKNDLIVNQWYDRMEITVVSEPAQAAA